MLFSLSSFYLFSTHNSLVFVFHFLLVRSNLLISLIICWRDDKSLRLLYNVRIKLILGPKVPYETDLRLALGQKYHFSLPIIIFGGSYWACLMDIFNPESQYRASFWPFHCEPGVAHKQSCIYACKFYCPKMSRVIFLTNCKSALIKKC